MNALHARFWYWVGLMYRFYGLRTGQRIFFVKADRAFCRALDFLPNYHIVRFNRGLLYWRELQAAARAIDDFTDVLNIYAEALFMRGMAYQQLGDYAAAARDLAAYLHNTPESRWTASATRQLSLLRAILDESPALLDSGD